MSEPTMPSSGPRSESAGKNAGDEALRAPLSPSGTSYRPQLTADADSNPNADTRVADLTPRSGSSVERLAVGKPRIEDYILLDEIHRGGQGVVYRALQVGTKRQVALKVLLEGPFASEDARRRFEREVELAASLKHPSIVTILDSGISEGRYYFAMEYIDGLRLDHYFRENRPPLPQTMELLRHICEAVNFAHQRGVIHRDLKPSNILVDKDGQPHILDFGLAKHTQTTEHNEITIQMLSTTGQILGTVAYMSPEQAAAPQDVDVRSDVYSLGVIFYEILLGQPPYVVAGPLGDVLNNIAHSDPVSPRSVRMKSRFGRQIDDELTTILLKTLEKDPARRYQTAGDLGGDLRRYLNGDPIEAKRASGIYMLKKYLRRYRVHAAVAAAVLLMLIGFMIMFAVLYSRESYARAEAETNRILATQNAAAAAKNAMAAQTAMEGERGARREAERAAEELRNSLVRQKIQQGDLARERGDLAEARDSYWGAYTDGESTAALWNLRQYYLETGEINSHQLYLNSSGPIAISPDGRVVATCTQPQSVAVRNLDTGQTIAWFPTPAKVECVTLSASGQVAAAGAGWARIFSLESQVPHTSLELPIAFHPESIHITRSNGLLLTDAVRVFSGSADGTLHELAFRDRATGRPDYSAALDMLAVPHQAGVDLISMRVDLELKSEPIWKTEKQPPRAVRFSGDDLLAVLAGGVDMVRIGGELHGQTVPFFASAENWDMVDLGQGIGTLVLGSREGTVAVYRSGTLHRTWRVTHGSLHDVHFVPQDGSLVTLDGRGTLTRWSTDKVADQRRGLMPGDALAWAVSADSSTIAVIDNTGRPTVFTPATDARPRPLPAGRFLSRLPGTELGRDDVSVALTEKGDRALLRRGNALTLANTQERRASWASTWKNSDSPNLKFATLSSDGAAIAVCSESQAGEQQRITIFMLENRLDRQSRRPPKENYAAAGSPINLSGSGIRGMSFIPGTHTLLLYRTNGAIETLEPEQPAPREYLRLDSPAAIMAMEGGPTPSMAVLSDDGVLRIFENRSNEPSTWINVGMNVGGVSFSPKGDALMVRSADGAVRLFDASSGEQIVRWAMPAAAGKTLAAWLDGDVLLIEAEKGVVQLRYGATDDVIRSNRRYARQRAIIRDIERGAFDDAWAGAELLQQEESEAGLSAEAEILESLLRRPTARVASDWINEYLSGADQCGSYLRLAFAAYAGRRFDQAHEWLERAADLAGNKLDAYSAWRMAQCDYLSEEYSNAAAALADLRMLKDLDPADVPSVQLQLTAALFLCDRIEQARAVGLQIGGQENAVARADRIALTTFRSIGRYIAGVGGENLVISTLSGLLANFAENSLAYHDDPYFFFGELARKRGDPAGAAVQYRRCIDTARDEWPSNWAAWRLEHSPRKAN